MKIFKIMASLVFLVLMSFAPANSMEPLAAEADSAYAQGDFAKAAAAYDSLATSRGVSAQLLYDLGNARYQEGLYGDAVLAYERALRLSPGNSMILNNLELLRSKVTDANNILQRGGTKNVEPESPTFFESIHNWFAKTVSSNTWAVCGIVAFLLLVGGVACYLFSGNLLLRKAGFFSSIALLVLVVVFVAFAFAAAEWSRSHDEGVIMVKEVELRSNPDADAAASSSSLGAGTKLHILEMKKGVDGVPSWYRVRLNSDFIGWVDSGSFEPI